MTQQDTKPVIRPNFSFHEALESFNVPLKEWLSRHDKEKEWDGLATGNLVFNSDGKALLIQRASHDSMPNRWEVPGGAVDDDDASILHGAARELWEESGLVAKRFTHIITTDGPGGAIGHAFQNSRKTKTFYRLAFHVEVETCESVKLDPQEHQDFVWASEGEIRAQKIGSREIPITHESVTALVLKGFEWRKGIK